MDIFSKTVALTPQNGGGLCITTGALQPADIIVSTTPAAVSRVIRVGTFSVVSHAALYCGGGMIVEAIGKGVAKHSLEEALADDVLAVAYRHPAMSANIATAIIGFAEKQVGKTYSVAGAVMSQSFILCRTVSPQSSGFFCSQLVLQAYRVGGLPLTTLLSSCVAPGDVVDIAEYKLRYVGHIKGNPSFWPVISP